jgi:hypothetical protein
MFGERLVWDEMFMGRLVGGRSIQAPEFWLQGTMLKVAPVSTKYL